MKSMHKFKVVAVSVLALFITGCSSTGLFILNSGLKIGSQHTVNNDIPYGDQPWQTLDVHVPERKSDQTLPVLVFFYGGSWDSGNKEMYYFVANSFAKRGYVVVIPDYVKYPRGRFPDFMQDGAQAIAWTFNAINQFGGDPEQVFIAGHSAGAHLGALLLADPTYLEAVGLQPTRVRGYAGLAGPYNFTPSSETLVEIFGPPERFSRMKVNTFVSGDEPAMLLLHGAEDSTVGVQNQTSLKAKVQEVGGKVETRVYDDTGHVKILMSLTPPLTKQTSALDDMDRFFKSQLTRKSGDS